MPGQTVNGTDPVAVFDSVNTAVHRARAGDGASLIEARIVRLAPHSSDDDDSRYRSPDERAAAAAGEPLQQVDDALAAAEASPEPTPAAALDNLYRLP